MMLLTLKDKLRHPIIYFKYRFWLSQKFCDQCGTFHTPPVSEVGFDGPDCPRYERKLKREAR